MRDLHCTEYPPIRKEPILRRFCPPTFDVEEVEIRVAVWQNASAIPINVEAADFVQLGGYSCVGIQRELRFFGVSLHIGHLDPKWPAFGLPVLGPRPVYCVLDPGLPVNADVPSELAIGVEFAFKMVVRRLELFWRKKRVPRYQFGDGAIRAVISEGDLDRRLGAVGHHGVGEAQQHLLERRRDVTIIDLVHIILEKRIGRRNEEVRTVAVVRK